MNRIIRVEIKELDSKGRGIGYINNRKIYVNYVVPGDVVDVEVYVVCKGRRGRYKEYHGKVINVVSEGKGRIKPKCKFFGVCGGCRFQNWDYNYQLRFKKDVVIEAMKRWGVNGEVKDIIPSSKIWYYRNRMDYAISYDGKVGLKEYGSWSKILDLTECYLMSEESTKIMQETRDFMSEYKVPGWDLFKHEGFLRYVVIREGKFTGDRMVNYITWSKQFKYLDELVNKLTSKNLITSFVWGINPTITDVSVAKDLRFIWGKDHLTEKIESYTFHVHPNAFFQTNSFQTITLAKLVRKLASGGRELLDLYSGVGLFSVFLSDMYDNVTGIEVEESAVNSGKISLKWNGVSNVNYVASRVEDVVNLYEDREIDTVIIDPPRPGMARKVVNSILRMSPKEIIYVSCNPDTMMRDTSWLCESYSIEDPIYPIDMFPHTPHVEVVARLVRK